MGFATDKYAILSARFPETNVLGVKTFGKTLYGTGLIGMFCCGNSNGVLLPYFTEEKELRNFKTSLGEYDVKTGVLKDDCTAIGNLIACNDKSAIVSPLVKDIKTIKDVLDVEVVKKTVGGHNEAGACLAVTNKGFLAHPNAEEELSELESILGVKGLAGSVNCGFPFVKSGLIGNSKGYLTGMKTTGIELGVIDDAFGFI